MAARAVVADLMTGDEPMTPAEKAAAVGTGGQGIGAARFANRPGIDGVQRPTNTLPVGADPAGWFIVGNKYVNCDGLTPKELEAQSPDYHRQKAEQARRDADAANDKYEKAMREMEAMQAQLQAEAAAQSGGDDKPKSPP